MSYGVYSDFGETHGGGKLDRRGDLGTRRSPAKQLLKPFDASLMRCYPVSARANQVANDDVECCRRLERPNVQPLLFS